VTSHDPTQPHAPADDNRGSTGQSVARPTCAAPKRSPVVERIEWAVFLVTCAWAVWLNVVLYFHAGGFWRDEASGIHLATLPQFGAMWNALSRDAFPGLFSVLLRWWIFAGPGGTDAGIRLLGTIISLGILASVFVAGRTLSGRPPLLALPLVALNPTMFYYGSSVRAYGLAALLAMLCAAAFWKVAQRPTRCRVAASLALAILSSHANYQNACLLLAIGVAGAVVCGACRLGRRSLLILGICALAAFSMLIYLPQIAEYQAAMEMVRETNVDAWTVASLFVESLTDWQPGLEMVWGVLILAAGLSLGADVFGPNRLGEARRAPSLPLYCLVLALVATVSGLVFFATARRNPQVWYFLPFLGVAALMVDAGTAVASRRWKSWARIVAALLVVAVSSSAVWKAAHTRRTNIDRIAQTLAEKAGPKDLILLNPLLVAPNFSYYYRGSAPWNTVPLLPHEKDLGICPFFPVRSVMATPHAITPTLQAIANTLASGNRLWIVGELLEPSRSPPADLPPAPHPQFGWNLSNYMFEWSRTLSYFLDAHALRGRGIAVPTGGPVNRYEDYSLISLEGWRGEPAAAPPH
jgi:hypothetical protein